ncbi:hypothetical protein B5X24_HaOG213147 [Helicoverpa armigera]|nr:hypothetical protein B5X24_HaOG213147 [Helicoverpa armigera]
MEKWEDVTVEAASKCSLELLATLGILVAIVQCVSMATGKCLFQKIAFATLGYAVTALYLTLAVFPRFHLRPVGGTVNFRSVVTVL